MIRWAFILGAAMMIAAPLSAQEADEALGLYVIYDSSNSMWGELADGSRKYESARTALTEFLTGDFGEQSLALRVYGARRADDCSDSELVVPFQAAQSAAPLMTDAVTTSRPTGRTPIHLSLTQALEDFGDRPGRILLISDGIESCGADPCALLQEWRDRDVDIDVHIVGFGLRAEERPALACMANAAGTPFVEAGTAGELAAALGQVRADSGEAPEAPATPSAFEQAGPPVLVLRLNNEAGEVMTGTGTAVLIDDDGAPLEHAEVQDIATHARNAIIPGRNRVRAGIRTRNGETPYPVEQDVEVASAGETLVALDVVEPPQVRTVFRQDGEVIPVSGMVQARIDGEAAFDFRAIDTVYVSPGEYVFRTSPNDFNRDMGVAVTVPESGLTEIVYDLQPTVRTTVRFFATPWGERIFAAMRFRRDGEEVASSNAVNAVRLVPGPYAYTLNYIYGPIEGEIDVPADIGETLDVELPMARVIVRHHDAGGTLQEDRRFFVAPVNARRRTQQSGTPFFLAPGTYAFQGRRGQYRPVEIEVVAGDDLEIILQETE